MTGWLDGVVAAVVIVGGSLGARWAGWRWHGWRLRRVHAQHAGGPPEMEPLIVGAGDRRFGSMGLDDDVALCEGCREHFHCDGGVLDCDCTCGWPEDWAEREEEFLPAEPDWRTQTMAELSPQALTTGPGPGPSSLVPGPDPDRGGCHGDRGEPGTTPVVVHETAAFPPTRLAHTGDIYGARLDLGPRAAAVLERYEQRRQERWALA